MKVFEAKRVPKSQPTTIQMRIEFTVEEQKMLLEIANEPEPKTKRGKFIDSIIQQIHKAVRS